MLNKDLKKLLLAGTAIVAVGAYAGSAQAADLTLTGNSTWGTTAPVNAPTASDNVELDGFNLLVNEGDVTQIGNITDTNATPDGTVTFDANAGGGAGTTVTVGSIVIGSGAITVQSTEATGGDADPVTVTVTNGITTTGALSVVGGSNNAGDHAILNVGGNISAGSIVVDDDAGGASATLVLNGTSAQTVTGVVSADGDVTISNTSSAGVTFVSDNTNTGTWLVGNDTNDVTLTLQGDAAANTITLGDGGGGADTATLVLDSSVDSNTTITIASTINGAATDSADIDFVGGGTIITTGTIGGTNVETGSVAASTTANFRGNTTIDALSLSAATSTVSLGGQTGNSTVTFTGNITGNGIVTLNGDDTDTTGHTITGNLGATGSGNALGQLNLGYNSTDADTTDTHTIAGSAYVTAVNFAADAATSGVDTTGATVTLNANNAVVEFGTVTTSADGGGNITMTPGGGAGSTFQAGNIGTSSAGLGTLTFNGTTAGAAATFTGNVYATTIAVDGAGAADLTFNSTGSSTVSAAIAPVGSGDGDVIIGDGTTTTSAPVVTFTGDIGSGAGNDLASLTVNSDATGNFQGAVWVDGALTNAGVVRVGVNKLLTAGSLSDTGGTFVFDLNDADGTLTNADAGRVDLGGAATITTADASVNFTGFVSTGTVDVLSNAGDAFSAAGTISDNSALYTVTAATNGTLTIGRAATSSFTSSKSNQAAADQIISIGTTATGNLATLVDNVASASTSTVNDVLEQSTSQVDAGAVVSGVVVGNTTANLNGARLASLRSGQAETGMVAGNMSQGLKTWGQVFGTTGTQDERDGVSGFDVDGYGITVGVDTETLAEDMTVGLAFTYADTEVDSDAASNANTEIDSYQIALYGDYDIDDRTYVTGQVSYMWSNNDSTRYNVGGVSGVTASGDFDASQFGIRAELARDYMHGDNMTLTPSVMANYMYYDADGYTETGAGTSNLIVGDADLDVFEIGLGLDAAWTVQNSDGSYLKPTVGVGVRHDLIGDEYETTNQFTGAGAAFKVEGFDPAQTTFDIGAGVTYFSTTNWELSASYDYEFKSDYDSHTGLVKAAYKF